MQCSDDCAELTAVAVVYGTPLPKSFLFLFFATSAASLHSSTSPSQHNFFNYDYYFNVPVSRIHGFSFCFFFCLLHLLVLLCFFLLCCFFFLQIFSTTYREHTLGVIYAPMIKQLFFECCIRVYQNFIRSFFFLYISIDFSYNMKPFNLSINTFVMIPSISAVSPVNLFRFVATDELDEIIENFSIKLLHRIIAIRKKTTNCSRFDTTCYW